MQNRKHISNGSREWKNGFSLIELLVTIAIIVMLSLVALVSFSQAGVSARNGRRQADLEQVRAGLVLYRASIGTYPLGQGADPHIDYNSMISTIQSYVSNANIQDPKASGSYFYWYISNGQTFTVCAALEPSATGYCRTNP